VNFNPLFTDCLVWSLEKSSKVYPNHMIINNLCLHNNSHLYLYLQNTKTQFKKYWNFKSVLKPAFKQENGLFSHFIITKNHWSDLCSSFIVFAWHSIWRWGCYCSLTLPCLGALNHVCECYNSINSRLGKWTLSWKHLDLIYCWSGMAVYNCWRPNPLNQLPVNLPSELP